MAVLAVKVHLTARAVAAVVLGVILAQAVRGDKLRSRFRLALTRVKACLQAGEMEGNRRPVAVAGMPVMHSSAVPLLVVLAVRAVMAARAVRQERLR